MNGGEGNKAGIVKGVLGIRGLWAMEASKE
jgi:hypothetical protein